MITSVLAAEALLGRPADPWRVNVEDTYLEDGYLPLSAADRNALLDSQPRVPSRLQWND